MVVGAVIAGRCGPSQYVLCTFGLTGFPGRPRRARRAPAGYPLSESHPRGAARSPRGGRSIVARPGFARPGRSPASLKSGVRVVPAEGRLAMDTRPTDGPAPLQPSQPNPPHLAELDRLGDQIAELSAHLEAATARLLALIREFDARGGWNNGFRSCAEWLAWRVGLDPGRGARTCSGRPRPRHAAGAGRGPGAGRALLCQGARADPHRHPGDRGAPAGGGARGHRRPRREHCPGLAAIGPTGRRASGRPPARGAGASRLPGRGWHRGGARAVDPGGGRVTHTRARRGPGDAVPAAARHRGHPAGQRPSHGELRPGRNSKPTHGAAGGDRAASGARSRSARGALSGGAPRGRGGPGRD